MQSCLYISSFSTKSSFAGSIKSEDVHLNNNCLIQGASVNNNKYYSDLNIETKNKCRLYNPANAPCHHYITVGSIH